MPPGSAEPQWRSKAARQSHPAGRGAKSLGTCRQRTSTLYLSEDARDILCKRVDRNLALYNLPVNKTVNISQHLKRTFRAWRIARNCDGPAIPSSALHVFVLIQGHPDILNQRRETVEHPFGSTLRRPWMISSFGTSMIADNGYDLLTGGGSGVMLSIAKAFFTRRDPLLAPYPSPCRLAAVIRPDLRSRQQGPQRRHGKHDRDSESASCTLMWRNY